MIKTISNRFILSLCVLFSLGTLSAADTLVVTWTGTPGEMENTIMADTSAEFADRESTPTYCLSAGFTVTGPNPHSTISAAAQVACFSPRGLKHATWAAAEMVECGFGPVTVNPADRQYVGVDSLSANSAEVSAMIVFSISPGVPVQVTTKVSAADKVPSENKTQRLRINRFDIVFIILIFPSCFVFLLVS